MFAAADDFEAGGNKFTTVFFGVGFGGGRGARQVLF